MKFYKRLLAMAIVATVFISVFAFGATAYGSDNDIPFIKEVAIAITQYIKTVKIWMLDLLYLITIMLVLNIMLQVTGMKKQINTAFHTNKFSVFDNYC